MRLNQGLSAPSSASSCPCPSHLSPLIPHQPSRDRVVKDGFVLVDANAYADAETGRGAGGQADERAGGEPAWQAGGQDGRDGGRTLGNQEAGKAGALVARQAGGREGVEEGRR